MFAFFQLFILFLFSISIIRLISYKPISFILSLVFSFFLTFQALSVYLNGNTIDYRFYEHANIENVKTVGGFFASEIILFSFIFIILIVIFNLGGKLLRARVFSKKLFVVFIFIGLIAMMLPNGIINHGYEIINLKTAKDKNFNQSLLDLGIDPSVYITAENIEATKGKNIIVLSLESLERGFLMKPNEALTPNLRKFAKNFTYLDMEENIGSNWTSGSVYTSITGIPAFFNAQSNEIFQNSLEYRPGNLGAVLATAGYDMTYFLAKKEFSGLEDMLSTFSFNVKSDRDFDTSYPITKWGIHDKDLFSEVKETIMEKANNKAPFAIFMSTISGHFPGGIYDSRMEEVVPAQNSNLKFATSSVDYLVGDLIAFLNVNGLMKNTVLFIFPDHAFMNRKHASIQNFKDSRGLYFISNAEEANITKNINEPILQIDIPRMIIDGSEIETNATFLTDFIGPRDKEVFLQRNKKNILSFNQAGLKTGNYKNGIKIVINNQGGIDIKALDNKFSNTIPEIENNKFYRVYFDDNLHYRHYRKLPHRYNSTKGFIVNGYYKDEIDATFKSYEGFSLLFSKVEDSIFGYLQNEEIKQVGVARYGEREAKFLPDDFRIFKKWKTLHPGEEPQSDKVYLKSVGWNALSSSGMSRIFTGLKPKAVKRGINLLYIENNRYEIFHTDTFATKDEARALLKMLSKLINNNKLIAIVVHDAATKELQNFKKELKKLGFPKLAEIKYREAYISILKDKSIYEHINPKSIIEIIDVIDFLPKKEIAERKQDTLRFIAHAGGIINGDTYTNSLEALNHNYLRGFRLFELDIIKTSDDQYVAAHDWKNWAVRTNYKGELPPTRTVFLDNPIKKYTSLDMVRINHWFREHPEAILVTDKVNEPKKFSSMFIDKRRLMMELFSLDAVKEGISEDILSAMPSERVFQKLRGIELETFTELGIKHIAISRRIIADKIPLLIELKKAGIKTYVFHLNLDKNRDENSVIENEMDYIYGIYADDWSFSKDWINKN